MRYYSSGNQFLGGYGERGVGDRWESCLDGRLDKSPPKSRSRWQPWSTFLSDHWWDAESAGGKMMACLHAALLCASVGDSGGVPLTPVSVGITFTGDSHERSAM